MMDTSLGLDINELKFIKTDRGDVIRLYHVFGNKESVLFRDITALEISSHSRLTQKEIKMILDDKIKSVQLNYFRKMRLFELSKLIVNSINERFIRKEFYENKELWNNIKAVTIEEWIQRWKDKARLTIDMWYDKYELKSVLDDAIAAFIKLRNSQTSSIRRQQNYANWYFYQYLPLYSSQSENI